MATQAQAQQALGERILAQLEDMASRLTALEAPAQIVPTPTDEAKPAPARKLTKAEKAAAKAKREAKAAGRARTSANVTAGRMPTAKFACRKDGCNFASHNDPSTTKHARKEGVDGHESFSL
jgi:hypothetical protein